MPFALPFAISLAFNSPSETLAAFAISMIGLLMEWSPVRMPFNCSPLRCATLGENQKPQVEKRNLGHLRGTSRLSPWFPGGYHSYCAADVATRTKLLTHDSMTRTFPLV